jgi:Ca2+-binding RTX toxin-like protein
VFCTSLLSGTGVAVQALPALVPAPIGEGFTVLPSDLAFILKQIKIAEHHAATYSAAHACDTLVGPGPNQIPDYLTSYGLRTVDGSCNNLVPGREKFAAADLPFPRLTTPVFADAEPITPSFPVGPPGPTSYKQKHGSVVDSQPRVISNLIVDQTSTNPAAVAAAGFPVRTQGNQGLFPCTTEPTTPNGTDGLPAGCVPAHHTMFIPNVTTNVGLSPPYNSLFTFFGQFFDHGVDQTVKGGGTVFVPLHADDPLIAGPDHILGTADDLPPQMRFMVLTRAQNQAGADGIMGTSDDIQNANNTDSPWIDQSQTYTSHASHQVFLREYVLNAANHPVSTGKLLGPLPALDDADGAATTGAISTWASTKAQAANMLGLLLQDKDATNIPMIAADPYGKFIPGPVHGLPQYVTTTGLVEGDLAAPVPVPSNVVYFDTPFLTDIAHNADPSPQDTDNNPATPPVAPIPDADSIASADFTTQPAGTYDNEMLDAHFTCGDGRCNENIALSSIHQVFHHEHDRLVDYIKNVLTTDTSPSGVAALAEWQLPTIDSPDGWNGERLFQAARFINEMEYQHTVFEEFARKMVPAIAAFRVYHPDVNAAIPAEFAHAVYRFGHSMLDETVARKNPDGSDNSTPLLHAFLNPPELFNAGGTCNTPPCSAAGILTPEQAAGAVVMGSSDQVGNEIDEFVTETLRNNLLGLPLDLATLNLTRAREAGVPPLNDVRRQIFARTSDGQLAPYASWTDFGQHLKHRESLINFVAAYGTHPTIRDSGPDGILGNGDDVTTLAAKRAAARAIVNPIAGDVPPADASSFMASTGAWARDANGVTTTGLDRVDLWVGGLAEVTNVGGGLLGSTFNYVFQTSMENLQDGDRLYYLARTAGLNLQGQLEGNSFAELIMRNTDGTNTLKADSFATADCKFQLANLDGTAAGYATFGSTVADDPTTGCNESLLLLRKPDGTIQYRAVNAVNPVGINGQSVYNGTPSVDRIVGGNDNDTVWGGAGNDIIDGNGGDDVVLGGDGNDIITDFAGADVLKGGPGNDAIDGGPDNDLLLGGDNQDFLNGGAGDNETFAGPGNDFVIGGTGTDTVYGDSGDDWIQGGTGQDLLHGDHAAPFLDDPAQVAPGNDILIGQAGGNDYDAEGGDDLMSQNTAVDRNAGAGGFDWAFHQYDTVAADDDMNINNNLAGSGVPIIVNRDAWQETEADSGGSFNDVIRGTNTVPSTIGGAGFSGCDVLDQRGVDRIAGLSAIVPQPLTGDPAPVIAAAVRGSCPLIGPIWGAGDILIGGTGSDTIEGRGGDDIIDGDRYLTVRISVRTNPADPATEIGSTDLMEHPAATGNFGPGTAGMTLQQAVFAGLTDPGNLVAVREIVTPSVPTPDCGATAPVNCDTAVFSGPQSDYDIRVSGDVVTVAHVRGSGIDGTDTLRNIEQLSFCSGTLVGGNCSVPRTIVPPVPTPGPTLSSITPPSASPGGQVVLHGANYTTATTVTFAAAGGTVPAAVTALTATQITVTVPATAISGSVHVTNSAGSSALSFVVIPPAPPVTPPAPPVTPPVPPVTPPIPPVVPAASPSAFTAVEPFRAFDTRPGEPGLLPVEKTKVDGAHLLDVRLTGVGGIPASGIAAISLNVTVADAEGSGFVTVYPCGAPPVVSSLNFVADQIVANAVIAPVSPDGNVCFFTNVPANLIVDVNGWFASGAGFNRVPPTRVLDTRAGESGMLNVPKAKVGGSYVLDIPLTNLGGLTPAAGITAVSLNVTVADAEGSGFVTVYPCGQPVASSVNFVAGQTVANAVIAPLSSTGTICFFSNVPTDLIVDINGWFAPGAGFNTVTPARVLDTRPGLDGLLHVDKSKVGPGRIIDVELDNIFGSAAVGKVSSVSLNVTVTNGEGPGFVTVFPCGAMPVVSSLNFVPGQTVANAVIAPLSSTGNICFYSSVPTDLVVDVNGWFAGAPV